MLPAANPDVLSSLLPHPRAPGLTPDAPNRHLSYGRGCVPWDAYFMLNIPSHTRAAKRTPPPPRSLPENGKRPSLARQNKAGGARGAVLHQLPQPEAFIVKPKPGTDAAACKEQGATNVPYRVSQRSCGVPFGLYQEWPCHPTSQRPWLDRSGSAHSRRSVPFRSPIPWSSRVRPKVRGRSCTDSGSVGQTPFRATGVRGGTIWTPICLPQSAYPPT